VAICLLEDFMKFHSIVLVGAFLVSAIPLRAQTIDWSSPDSVAQAAIAANASLRAREAQIRAAGERVGPAGSLPNPMIMGGVQDQQINFSIDEMMTMYMVGASQTLTRGSRRRTLRSIAELEVERLERESQSQRAEVERAASFAWHEAAAAQSQIAATEEIAGVARTTVDAARTRYEAGLAPQSDMIRAMLQETDLQHQLLSLRGRRRQAIARLVALLRLPAATEVPPFTLSHQMAAKQIEALPEMTPAITALQAEVERAEQEVKLARLARKPDLTVEASYGLRPEQTDMFSVVGRIELPFRKATIIEPRIREAMAQRDAAQQQIEALRQQLREDLGVALALRDEAIEQVRLHTDRLVPEAKIGFQSTLGSYQAGKDTFESVLSSLRMYLNLNIDLFDFLKQQMLAEADIEAIRKGARSGMSAAGSAMLTAPRPSAMPPAGGSPMGMR
jgi:cobalt-zinc-cadmium efflux system outer membrane protein